MMTFETLASAINALIEKVHPWYTLRFLRVGEGCMLMIGSTQAELALSHPGEYVLYPAHDAPSDVAFVEHVNGILAGMVRDDEGNLQPRDATKPTEPTAQGNWQTLLDNAQRIADSSRPVRR
jgi:hypothetical protein